LTLLVGAVDDSLANVFSGESQRNHLDLGDVLAARML
jgi:hypothetical protein